MPDHYRQPSRPADRLRRLLRRGKYLAGEYEVGLPVLLRLTPQGVARRIDTTTELVVEGFPRSGNTFAVFAFKHANTGVAVASHVHHVAQLKRAARLGKPLVIVIRPPLDCLASYLVAGPHAWPAQVLDEYIDYHHSVADLAGSALIVTFDDVVSDMGAVTEAVNRRFGTQFRRFDHTTETQQEVFDEIDRSHRLHHGNEVHTRGVARPEPGRTDERRQHRRHLESAHLADRLAEARSAFAALS